MSTNTIPQTLVAGETLNYRASVADYPASDGWSLRLVLNPRAGGTVLTVDSTADGDDHVIQVSAATTSGWTAGDHGWEIWALAAGEQYRLEAGQLVIEAGLLAAAAGADTRTPSEIALANIQAVLQGRASDGVLRYTVAGRSLERYSIAELLQLESRFMALVARERAGVAMNAGLKNPRKIAVRMGRA